MAPAPTSDRERATRVDMLTATALGLVFTDDLHRADVLVRLAEGDETALELARWRVHDVAAVDVASRVSAAAMLGSAAEVLRSSVLPASSVPSMVT